MNVLGVIKPDPVSQLLGTGYLAFESHCGINGLAKTNIDRLDILAVHSPQPGQGAFRRFILKAKSQYRTVCIWEVWNQSLARVLERYGFTPETEILDSGQSVQGYRWDTQDALPNDPIH